MINITQARLRSLAMHQVGNKTLDEGVTLSEVELSLHDGDLVALLEKYFLSSFTGTELFRLYHESDINLNESFVYAKKMFASKGNMLKQSQHFAQHLYECSTHSKIKGGEVYVGYFRNVAIGDELVDAIGIFKTENKDTFLKIDKTGANFELHSEEGVNTNKPEKGCLILNTEAEDGFRVCVIDNQNRSAEAQYWKDNFLHVRPVSNAFYQTNEVLNITKTFVTKQLTEEFEVSKADQIDMLNRSVDYFKKHETFEKEEFEKEVLKDKEVIKSFRSFDETYREENAIEDVSDNFEISAPAVKKQARNFKSVLKLDKNFHVYIHGDRSLIEQGVDKDGRKYYKIYFEKEL